MTTHLLLCHVWLTSELGGYHVLIACLRLAIISPNVPVGTEFGLSLSLCRTDMVTTFGLGCRLVQLLQNPYVMYYPNPPLDAF
jgi:hypothetical protein